MTDPDYFARAGSWAADAQVTAARSRRAAWLVAGLAIAVAVFEALALAMLAPLKTVQPVTLLVDKQTGYVQALDPLSPRRIAADDALTNSLLAQYVTAREEFDRATVAADYRRVALWSAGPARQSYLTAMPAASPDSPFQRYSGGAVVDARVKSVSRLNEGVALVRFDTQLADRSGRAVPSQPWIAVVRYRYADAPMRFEDRLVNPLGFQVVSYRRDPEAPPPLVVQSGLPPSVAAAPAVVTTTTVIGGPTTTTPTQVSPAPQPRAPTPRRVYKGQTPISALESREVPVNNLPMGSPLSPGSSAVVASRVGEPR